MKFVTCLCSFVLSSSIAFSHSFFPSVNINVNPNKKDTSHLKLTHETFFYFDNDHYLILNGHYKPHLNNKHHFESEIGYRKFWDGYGFGINHQYIGSTVPGIFSHQFGPGVEFFAGRFQLSFNHYVPLKKEQSTNKSQLLFSNISEFGINYKISRKMEVGLLPYFDHQKQKFGINGNISLLFYDTLTIGVQPFMRPSEKGVSFSIGINFGGNKSSKMQPIRKTHGVFFVKNKKIKEAKKPVFQAINLPASPTKPLEILPQKEVKEPEIRVEKDVIKKKEETPPQKTNDNGASTDPKKTGFFFFSTTPSTTG